MPKETFQRNKPHCNVGLQTSRRLQQAGVSELGARQALQGQIITDPDDRVRIADILTATTGRDQAHEDWVTLLSVSQSITRPVY